MKPADDLKRRIARMSEATGRELDERVIADIRDALPTSSTLSIWRSVKMVVAAAVVAVAVWLAVTLFPKGPEPSQGPRAPLSVSEMVTVKHLNVTYRQGGMQALNALCEEVAERVDLAPRELTVNKLIAELNGT